MLTQRLHPHTPMVTLKCFNIIGCTSQEVLGQLDYSTLHETTSVVIIFDSSPDLNALAIILCYHTFVLATVVEHTKVPLISEIIPPYTITTTKEHTITGVYRICLNRSWL